VSRPVLLDTGPLVAALDRRDQHHAWAKAQFDRLEAPLLTCEAVLSESCFLLGKVPGGGLAVMGLVRRGAVSVPFRFAEEAEAVADLIARYADVPMSFADACLVRMAEQHRNSAVLTLDRDFTLYRKNRRQVIPTIMPDDA
jgi:predicted nucleic acid-binding protein